MSKAFIEMEITKDEEGQHLKLIFEDKTEEIYHLKDFPYQNGGPVITGKWFLNFIKTTDIT